MNNDERAIEDEDMSNELPDDSLDTDHFVDAYDKSSDDDLEEAETGTRSEEVVEAAGGAALSDDELDDDDEAGSEDELAAVAAEPETEAPAVDASTPLPVFNNFMDALYPKRAPAARNARIVRRFDLEAAKYDPRPAVSPAPVVMPSPVAPVAPVLPEKKKEPLTREEARALRNRSLRAAAGLD